MARIDLKTSQIGSFGTGDLQLQNGDAMDATLRLVTDSVNTASPLKLSTSLVQSTSTIKITTSDVAYIDAEDNSGNNRFTVSRAVASQLVTVDFASVPSSLTTPVGAIRTATDGVNLANVMTFLENGNIGIGTSAPTVPFEVTQNVSGNLFAKLQNTNSAGFGLVLNGGAAASTYTMQFADYNGSGGGRIYPDGIFIGGQAAPTARLQVKGSGSTSATTSLLVQNSAGTQLLNIRDDGFTTIGQSNQGISTHNLTATNYIVCGSTSAHYFQLGAGLVLRSPSDGVATFLNGAESGFNRINLGGTTSSFPAIKRNAAQIDFKLADDSTFAAISSGGLIVNGNSITLVGAIGNTSAMRIDAGATTGLLRLSTTSVNIGGNTTNDASALLQVDTTTQGFLPPRMTTVQKNAIATPAAGLMVYDSTLNKLCVYTTAWETITSI